MSDMKHYTLTVREVLQSLATLAMQYEAVSRGASPTGNYFFAVNVADVAANLKAAQALILQLPYWIPVSERLPENGQQLLACVRLPHWTHEMPTLIETMDYDQGRFLDDDLEPRNYVTHWMPLPEPPPAE